MLLYTSGQIAGGQILIIPETLDMPTSKYDTAPKKAFFLEHGDKSKPDAGEVNR